MALVSCPSCGHRVSTAAPSCPGCGRPGPGALGTVRAGFQQPRTCPGCGRQVTTEKAAFCTRCGSPVAMGTNSAQSMWTQTTGGIAGLSRSHVRIGCAAGIVGAFFMPWIAMGPIGVAGYQLAGAADERSFALLAYAIPVLGILTVLSEPLGPTRRTERDLFQGHYAGAGNWVLPDRRVRLHSQQRRSRTVRFGWRERRTVHASESGSRSRSRKLPRTRGPRLC